MMGPAWRDTYGPPEVVQVRDVERPLPTRDQVLVRVRAASVNRADLDNLYPRWQFLRLFLGVRNPRVLRVGSDVAASVKSTVRTMPAGPNGVLAGERHTLSTWLLGSSVR